MPSLEKGNISTSRLHCVQSVLRISILFVSGKHKDHIDGDVQIRHRG